jgi:hypothetical protein
MADTDTLPSTELSTLSFDGETLGPAMQALPNDMQRRFVIALARGANTAIEAARMAGYSATSHGHASRLSRDPRIQAALLEEAAKVVRVSAVKVLSVLDEIAFDKQQHARDRLKAAEMILARGGFAEINRHQVDVVHRTDAQLKHELLAMAAELGMDEAGKAKLIGKPVVTDAEFVEVVDNSRTDEDRERDRTRKAQERARTPEEREAHLQALHKRKVAESKRRYAEAQARLTGNFEGLEDLLSPAPSDDPSGHEPEGETTEEPFTDGVDHAN